MARVAPHETALGQDVTLHGLQQFGLAGSTSISIRTAQHAF